jgi:hypothetical protein
MLMACRFAHGHTTRVNMRCDQTPRGFACTDADGAGHTVHGWATRRHERGGDGQRVTRGAAAYTIHHDAQLHGVAQPTRRHARRVLARSSHHGGVPTKLVPRPRGQGHGDQRARRKQQQQQQQQARRAGRAGATTAVHRPGEAQASARGVKAASHPSRVLRPSRPAAAVHPHPRRSQPHSCVCGTVGSP